MPALRDAPLCELISRIHAYTHPQPLSLSLAGPAHHQSVTLNAYMHRQAVYIEPMAALRGASLCEWAMHTYTRLHATFISLSPPQPTMCEWRLHVHTYALQLDLYLLCSPQPRPRPRSHA
jgi:hypothetical protein